MWELRTEWGCGEEAKPCGVDTCFRFWWAWFWSKIIISSLTFLHHFSVFGVHLWFCTAFELLKFIFAPSMVNVSSDTEFASFIVFLLSASRSKGREKRLWKDLILWGYNRLLHEEAQEVFMIFQALWFHLFVLTTK